MVRPRIVGLIQARMGSGRLPGKVLMDLAGEPMLVRVVDRVRQVERLDEVAVVTGRDMSNDPIRALCAGLAIPCFSGDDDDVLTRYHDAADHFSATGILRITADCPLVDPLLLSLLVCKFELSCCHYAVVVTGASDVPYPRYPDGLDAECLSGYALEYAFTHTPAGPDREHVTRILWREPRPLDTQLVTPMTDMGTRRWTVDDAADYDMVRLIYQDAAFFGLPPTFSYLEIITRGCVRS